MDSRKRKPISNTHFASPLPNPPLPSSIFRDLSNLKTPKIPLRTPSFKCSPQFFTASKNTPISSARRGFKTSALKSKAARRLKAFEIEQSKSARKAQAEKEQSLKSLARSLTVWLNFLFENPSSCGCDPASFTGEIDGSDPNLGGGMKEVLANYGKREGVPGQKVGVNGPWRGPKRQRGLLWGGDVDDEVGKNVFTDSYFPGLRTSLQEICSFEDLKGRMRMYLSLASCKDIFKTMAQVTKNIDDGRLKMRASCPIVSDVGMKERALKLLMCYNPVWLRIGLYIIFGGDSLLPNADVNSEQENTFLRMVLEKQFFTHPGLARAHVYNKLVEGLYRPGYYEKLGNVILKRFLLLVIILDRAKSQTSIPLKYGIDGLDGGSPPLFSSKSKIKSSRQLITDFLSSDVMHGEGSLLAHLVIVGYKVTYQQNPLIDYEFKVVDLFEDLRDGIRLCRAIELLKHDTSILMKVVVPSDTQKKSQVNCGIALQFLKQAGVPIVDEDGTEIIGEDVVNGDKELTLALLWNIFVHLQLPLFINNRLLLEEISNIRGSLVENSGTQPLLDLLISWVQAICETYELKVESQSSLLDGKAMWCLLDYYFRKEHNCSSCCKNPDGTVREVSIMSAIEYTDAVHNFILSQKLTSLLGNFPEVLQVSDIIEHNGACNGQSVIVLLAFLAVQLLVKRNMDKLNFHKLLGFSCQITNSRLSSTDWDNVKDPTRNFKAIMAWWQDMAQQNGKCSMKPAPITDRKSSTLQRENAALIIQSHYRRLKEYQNYKRIANAAQVLQTVALAWLSLKKKTSMKELSGSRTRGIHLQMFGTYVTFMADRHYFVNLKWSVRVIQRAIRAWIAQRHCNMTTNFNHMQNPDNVNAICAKIATPEKKSSVISREDSIVELWTTAAITIQRLWKDYALSKSIQSQHLAATRIQSHFRGWLMAKNLACKKQAILRIQRSFRCLRYRRNIQIIRDECVSAIVIQSHVRGWMARREVCRKKNLFIGIQSFCRGWLQRKEFLLQKDAAIKIQSVIRQMNCSDAFVSQRHMAIEIQSVIRGENTRKRLLGASHPQKASKHRFQGLELQYFIQSIVKLQRWWRHVLRVREKTNSVMVIQSYVRGWIARQTAEGKRQSAVVIQSYWKGYLARKHARDQLLDLRLRMQISAANVDESRRLINRLIAALSELLNMRSVSNILHTCATLDMATELSQKCCEELVAAGAVGTLLKLIRSVSRSIPDQQVLKHALSTLRNLARYPALTEILVESRGCMETIVIEFLRNKEEGYFIASELLKRICGTENGANAIRKSPALLKRLNNLADDLSRKAGNDKRKGRNLAGRENAEMRLREVVELLKLVASA
ncbi:Unknown protein [Striga hermonthica]|uniref:Calponin-homology (CH) domain-containing protein n=1 Tax=Striga hermonthica TaxID=68872 RepID=A0A9N7N9S6_STRHE|nr:Unknown protein [Striga hermonthica]